MKLFHNFKHAMTEQRNSQAYVHCGNPTTEEWELIGVIDVIPSMTPDVTSMTMDEIFKLQRGVWREFNLPNGEIIEVKVVHNIESNTFILNVRQDSESLVQIICDILTSIIFRTLKLAVMEIGYGASERMED